MKSLHKYDVVVVGAGVAGLAALQVLDQAGLRVIVLEARDRVGGRIHTIHDPLSSLPLELGAEFVHGRPVELWEIIRSAQLPVFDGTDASRYMHEGQVQRDADAWSLVDGVLEDMRTASQGPDQSFEQFLNTTTYSQAIKRAARGYIEGFNAAKSSLISIHALAQESAAATAIDGDLVFRFSHGYDAVPLQLLRGTPRAEMKLRLNSVVRGIEWEPGSVAVQTNQVLTNVEEVWHARQALITLPLGVVQAGTVSFSPPPGGILEAARRLEFGQVYRVVLRFRKPFWEDQRELKDAGFILSAEELFPTWWTSLAMRSTLLTGWSAGAHAEGLQGLSREEILSAALTSLARITGFRRQQIDEQLEAMYFHDWEGDPYALGAYSYVATGGLEARKALSVPVKDTLYFAGEATDQGGHSATVHGAIASGRRAAQQILRAVKPRSQRTLSKQKPALRFRHGAP